MTNTDESSVAPPASHERRETWWRGAFMLFFIIAFGLGQALINLTAVFQFLSMLIAGKPNEFLTDFGRSLGKWFEGVAAFQSGASEDKPFPWSAWPSAE